MTTTNMTAKIAGALTIALLTLVPNAVAVCTRPPPEPPGTDECTGAPGGAAGLAFCVVIEMGIGYAGAVACWVQWVAIEQECT